VTSVPYPFWRKMAKVDPSETVRKAPEALAVWPYGLPKSSFLAHFVLRIPAKFRVGALLIALFGQFRSWTLAIHTA
jgi:hypothetical protein